MSDSFSKRLLIVESPSKTKKIRALLGPGWEVQACFGHVRDLPEKEMGLSPPDFKPQYVVLKRAVPHLKKLKEAAQQAGAVYLATDPDREGEAIAWHLSVVLRLKQPLRVAFHEITEKAVKAAVAQPRPIDLQWVAAQEARRALDRLVGYRVSPELCRRMDARLSAGRVQSPALRLVVDREREIEQFKPLRHFAVTLLFDGDLGEWWAHWLVKPLLPEGEEHWTDEAYARKVAETREVRVVACKDVERRLDPPAPFITSTLQQAASAMLNMNPKQTMDVAQALFEQGLITYMRTDSPNLAEEAVRAIRAYCETRQWPLPPQPRVWRSKSSAQEAHEAIRPTHVQDAEAGETPGQRSLYRLIWQRAVASQMASAIFDQRQAVLEGEQPLEGRTLRFGAKGERLKFKGWLALTDGDAADEGGYEGRDNPIPPLSVGESRVAKSGRLQEKKTEPPKRYTQAGLVRALERLGIGRPSTYAAIMEGLVRRNYVLIKGKSMCPTDIGKAVVDVLKPAFGFLDYAYTSQMEDQLDEIAQGLRRYLQVVAETDAALSREIAALLPAPSSRGGSFIRAEVDTGAAPQDCPRCGKPLRRIHGKRGWFWGCSAYREGCAYTRDDGEPQPAGN